MQKIALKDIRGPKIYAAIRDDLRKSVIALKRPRRVHVGPDVTLVFENRATVIFQIEEMCRAEGISTPEKIAEEIDVYNALIPDAGQLSATLLIEITDEAEIEPKLTAMIGLQNHVWLVAGDARCRAEFDPNQFKADKFAAVQYLRFSIPEVARASFSQGVVTVETDHPNYRHQTALSEACRASLAADLA